MTARTGTPGFVIVAILAALLLAAPAGAATITVNTDDDDGGAGDCELRDAIAAANTNAAVGTCTAGQVGPTVDLIQFNVGGGGLETIGLTAELPTILDVVTIDGATQPGFAGSPLIEVDGSALTATDQHGFTFDFVSPSPPGTTSSGSALRGLVINGFNQGAGGNQSGVLLSPGSNGNTIAGNYIGVEPDGVTADGNGLPCCGGGIFVGSHGNTIGGPAAAQRNVIAGNASGVSFFAINAHDNVFQGNYVGIGADGTTAVPHNFTGVAIEGGASGNTIGGAGAGQGNVISNSGFEGVRISNDDTMANVVQGNLIGTDASGAGSHGNEEGVLVRFNAHDNLIGGTGAGEGNVIANSERDGVVIGGDQGSIGTEHDNADRNAILGNSIFANGTTTLHLGIDIDRVQTTDGVTPNDAGDGDAGPNDEQNFPVLNGADPGTDTVAGLLDSLAATSYRLEFFANPGADTSGFGEGQRFLGAANVTTVAAGGQVGFSTSVANFDPGEWITATATRRIATVPRETSEFSQAIQAPLPPAPPGGGGVTLIQPPSNLFSFGAIERRPRKGIAFITVNVPGPGNVSLGGTGVAGIASPPVTASVQAPAAGAVRLKVKPVGKARRKLRRTGKAKVTAEVTFTPIGGSANTESTKVKLVKR